MCCSDPRAGKSSSFLVTAAATLGLLGEDEWSSPCLDLHSLYTAINENVNALTCSTCYTTRVERTDRTDPPMHGIHDNIEIDESTVHVESLLQNQHSFADGEIPVLTS